MNFLRNKKLKHLGAYLLLLTVFIFVVQFFILDRKIEKLEEAELRQEYTRIVQVANQQIAIQVLDYINGNRALASGISAQLGEQERRLRILASGGRVEQSDDFVQPLHRLPRITFEGMKEDWTAFSESIVAIINTNQTSASPAVQPQAQDTLRDSSLTASQVPLAILVNTPKVNVSDIRYQGLALSMTKWFDRLMADLHEEVEEEKSALSRLRLFITLFNIIVVGGIYFLFYQFVLQPLNRLTKNGGTQLLEIKASSDEIGEVAKSINNTVEQLKDASDFVMAIGKGNLSVDYKNSFDHSYVPGTNQLADSLIEMQSKLKELNEEEQKRKWANEGLARFVDILRSSNDNMHVLGDKVIAALVQYTKANQGGLYIVNEEESSKHLELISLFAFDIKKHEQQRVKPGQGILGQTYLEKETTYLTSLPEEYIRISSGLGGANPKTILIVPLKVDREVYGLVELASFNEFQPHEIAFVEKLGESIASTLASVRAAQRNKNLIEQFQQQTEQMRAQEEEMRQNMEELQATQEEVVRKEKNYIERIAELEKTLQDSRSSTQADETVLRDFAEKENEYKRKLADLQKELEAARKKGEEWEIANELVRTLRFNLEALKISEEQSGRKR